MAKKEPQSCITTPYKTTCGGQALIEGIMMQGPDRRAVVVRKPDGELDVTTWEVKSRKSIWRLPFLRGLKTFCSSMYHGIKALMYSADVSGEMEVEDEELTGLDKWINDHFSDEKASALIIGIAAVIAMVEIGQGSTLQIKNTIASMGADTLNIRPGAISKSGVNTGAGGRASLTNADCEAIAKDCPRGARQRPSHLRQQELEPGNCRGRFRGIPENQKLV